MIQWTLHKGLTTFAVFIVLWSAPIRGQDATEPPRQSLDEALWTGPMLAPSAATLPRGHFLVEPYLYVVQRPHDHRQTIGSLTYLNFGLMDRLTLGVIPTFGYNISKTASSTMPGVGDLTAQAQYRLTTFTEGKWVPATSVAVLESFPTGKYDRLGDHPADGLGTGARITSVALYSQRYFWLPTGRILRMRFNVTHGFAASAHVSDVSVYDTEKGFRGSARLGPSTLLDGAWEYSLTKHWVLALDGTYTHTAETVVNGKNSAFTNGVESFSNLHRTSGSSDAFAVAPAIEYNWNRNVGVLLGVRVIPRSHNTAASITPAVAVNIVR